MRKDTPVVWANHQLFHRGFHLCDKLQCTAPLPRACRAEAAAGTGAGGWSPTSPIPFPPPLPRLVSLLPKHRELLQPAPAQAAVPQTSGLKLLIVEELEEQSLLRRTVARTTMHLCRGRCLLIIFCSATLILVIRVASLVQTIHSLLFCFPRDVN